MEGEQLDEFVLAYLKKKGFKLAAKGLQEDLQQNKDKESGSNTNGSSVSSIDFQNDPELSKLIRSFSQSEDDPARYREGYSKLRSWAYDSLDLYKHELLRVMYPVFIHSYMDLVAKGHTQDARAFFNSFREAHEIVHLRELQKLEGVLSPSHLEEMEFARSLRQSKVNIRICQYSYDLLLQYLHRTESTIMLGIINEHINFQVYSGQPTSASDDTEAVTLIGSFQDTANHINQKEIQWGLLEDCLEDRFEKTGGLPADSDKGHIESKDGEMDDSKKRAIETGKHGSSIKKLKKDKAANAAPKVVRQEASTVSTAPRVKPELSLPVMSTDVEQSILEDLRNRVQLSSVAMPSVSFYTFINTHNGLNCVSMSHDGSLVAGGFSDSSLKVWDMAKIGQAGNSALQGEIDASDQAVGVHGTKRNYTLFLGHSGPVYSATFNPSGDFVLSSSADTTIRLWSTKLNANLVCYKGHNYPVWDVQFSPLGHYFASCSHDRTARIWSMDRIQPLRIMAGHLSDVDCVQWHANCNYIATGSSDKTVRLWDVQTGECVRIFIGHRSMVLSLAMSPDGRYMASGDEDGTIMMWDLSTARCITPLMGHNSCVWSLDFSCEGSLLASGSADCTVKLWDITSSTKMTKAEEKSGNPNRLRSLKTFPTKSTPVQSLRFSRRNLLFAAGALSKPGN
ncbi:PREDICTED: transcription initiation factor TFIID subunit 5 [Tarenaya hassleriana]|uniref:transcription initiation factor TFIID subunit 5 n=1 Tax=Tarenaya hassleriana TaxID=28532 RepID=UPI00053C2C75|nr:PREDICTED: transcription initiation factor TFIID subunit 5 [Tarenaya hassleriana]XP_010541565.1 PREDICTED: transcription initiation factor TFIID subunit 5 [Tarenaya hassleriana]XP_019058243.1 PREDICTED: transcription initiation factor TFIID subunit 5 [Tarenaya hassleriana]